MPTITQPGRFANPQISGGLAAEGRGVIGRGLIENARSKSIETFAERNTRLGSWSMEPELDPREFERRRREYDRRRRSVAPVPRRSWFDWLRRVLRMGS